jgi:hypothetical protein
VFGVWLRTNLTFSLVLGLAALTDSAIVVG